MKLCFIYAYYKDYYILIIKNVSKTAKPITKTINKSFKNVNMLKNYSYLVYSVILS